MPAYAMIELSDCSKLYFITCVYVCASYRGDVCVNNANPHPQKPPNLICLPFVAEKVLQSAIYLQRSHQNSKVVFSRDAAFLQTCSHCLCVPFC